MRVTVLLADAAQVDPGGKVHAIGLGWTVTGTPTPTMGVIVMVEVGWDETNKKIALHGALVDADGNAVCVPGPLGEQPLTFDGEMEAGRPPGMPPGTPVAMPIAINLPPGLQLTPGQRYEWRVSLNGKSHADWTASFLVRPQQ